MSSDIRFYDIKKMKGITDFLLLMQKEILYNAIDTFVKIEEKFNRTKAETKAFLRNIVQDFLKQEDDKFIAAIVRNFIKKRGQEFFGKDETLKREHTLDLLRKTIEKNKQSLSRNIELPPIPPPRPPRLSSLPPEKAVPQQSLVLSRPIPTPDPPRDITSEELKETRPKIQDDDEYERLSPPLPEELTLQKVVVTPQHPPTHPLAEKRNQQDSKESSVKEKITSSVKSGDEDDDEIANAIRNFIIREQTEWKNTEMDKTIEAADSILALISQTLKPPQDYVISMPSEYSKDDLFAVFKKVLRKELNDILDDAFNKWTNNKAAPDELKIKDAVFPLFSHYLENESNISQLSQLSSLKHQNILIDAFSKFCAQNYQNEDKKLAKRKNEQKVLQYFQDTKNKKIPNNELFKVLKSGTLMECYRSLSVLNKYNLDGQDFNELRKLLPEIRSKTEIYVSTFTASKIIAAKTMKMDCHNFLQILKNNKDKETYEISKELETLWKAVDGFKIDQSARLQIQESAKIIENVQKWFSRQPVCLFSNKQISNQQTVEEILTHVTLPMSQAQCLSHFICKTIDFITKFYNVKWEIRLYIYDRKTKCSIAFTNKTYYVDHYGNCYYDEMSFLQALRFLTGFFDIMNHENKPLDIRLPDNDEFLEIVLKSFTSLVPGNISSKKTNFSRDVAFSNFLKDFKDDKNNAITLLKQLKAFHLFFRTVEEYTFNTRIFYYLVDEKLQLHFFNFDYYEVDVKTFIYNFHNFETFFKNVNLHLIKYGVYGRTSLETVLRGVSFTGFVEYRKEICEDVFKKKHNCYFNICHYITVKIIEHLKADESTQMLVENLNLSDIKYVVYWVASKYEDEEEAMIHFKINEVNIKNEYSDLIKAINKIEKTEKILVPHKFFAVYNFCVNLPLIRETVISSKNVEEKIVAEIKMLPEINDNNKKNYFTSFLKYLPLFVELLSPSFLIHTIWKISRPSPEEKMYKNPVTSSVTPKGSTSTYVNVALPIKEDFSKVVKMYNIVLLGPHGAGKSTFVNAIANYFTYETFDEAIDENEPVCVTPSSFNITLENFENISITVRGINSADIDNEDFGNGNSSTEEPRVYSFYNNEVGFNIIDIPGIGDDSGMFQDSKNKSIIADKIKQFSKIHSIFIVFNAVQSNLTPELQFSLNEALMMLHAGAIPNIMFVITNSRGYDYRPGNSMNILRKYVTNLETTKGIKIELNENTVFCLDNESFRFQCIWNKSAAHRKEFASTKHNYSRNWQVSREVVFRLFRRTHLYKEHEVKLTSAVENPRWIIHCAIRALATIQAWIRQANTPGNRESNINSLTTTGMQIKNEVEIEKTHPQTVCTSKKCIDAKRIPGSNQFSINYITVCHDNCHLKTATVSQLSEGALEDCNAFDYLTGNCYNCGCNVSKHMHIQFKQSQRQIAEKVSAKPMSRKAAEQFFNSLVEAQQKELDHIMRAVLKFSCYLKQNAISEYNNSFEELVKFNIRKEQAALKAGNKDSEEVIKKLEISLQKYKEEMILIDISINEGKSQKVTEEEIHDIMKSLFYLKYNGENIRKLYEAEMSQYPEYPEIKTLDSREIFYYPSKYLP